MTESTIPSGSDEKRSEPKVRSGVPIWLICGLAIFLLLFFCGQIAMTSDVYNADAPIESNLDAEYIEWEPMRFVAINPKIISEIFQDEPLTSILIFQSTPDCFFLGLPCEAEAKSAVSKPGEATPTFIPTATETEVVLIEDSPTPTVAPTDTVVFPSATATEEDRRPANTATDTPIPSETPTSTPIPPTEPVFTLVTVTESRLETGEPDGDWMNIGAGNAIILDVSSNPIIVDETPNPDPDIVYYEREYDDGNPLTPPEILLDLVIIQIGQSSTGEWFVVFNWGDDVPDGNTNIDYYATDDGDGEIDNEPISMNTPSSPLYGTPDLNTGITIDVDAKVSTPGVYDQIMIGAPSDGGDPAEVDAVEVLPTATP